MKGNYSISGSVSPQVTMSAVPKGMPMLKASVQVVVIALLIAFFSNTYNPSVGKRFAQEEHNNTDDIEVSLVLRVLTQSLTKFAV